MKKCVGIVKVITDGKCQGKSTQNIKLLSLEAKVAQGEGTWTDLIPSLYLLDKILRNVIYYEVFKIPG